MVNPLAPEIKFDERSLSSRRDLPKLLNLMNSLAFLKQMQRESRRSEGVEFIEVTREDVELAEKLFHKRGSQDEELSEPTAKLLDIVNEFVRSKHVKLRKENADIKLEEVTFTRRELREFSKWTNTRLHIHVNRLLELEMLAVKGGTKTGLRRYWLAPVSYP